MNHEDSRKDVDSKFQCDDQPQYQSANLGHAIHAWQAEFTYIYRISKPNVGNVGKDTVLGISMGRFFCLNQWPCTNHEIVEDYLTCPNL